MTKMLGVQEEPAIYKVLASRMATERRALRSLGRWSGGGTPSKSNPAFWSGGTIPWVSPKDMKLARISDAEDHITPEAVARSATSLIKAGAVVLVVRSGILQHSLPVAVTDVDVALNQDLKALQPSAGVDATYVAWALRAHAQAILRLCTKAGTTVQSIEMPALLDYEIPLPSAERQREVVETVEARLSVLDASVAALHRVQANLKRYRASVLKSACEGRLVPTEAELAHQENRDFETGAQLLRRILAARRARVSGRSKYKEPSTPAAIHLSDAPEGWAWSNVDQLAEVGTGATPKRDVQAFYEGGHIAWVTSGAVNGEYVDQASEFVTERALAETNLSVYPPGTLLLAMYGEGKTRGRCSELRIAATTNQALAAIQAAEPVRRYLRLLLERSYEETRKAASGGVQPNLNLSLVRAIAVPLPPLAEQHRIVAEADRRLSLIRVAEAQVAANLARAQRLRQSILQAAFRTPAQARQ